MLQIKGNYSKDIQVDSIFHQMLITQEFLLDKDYEIILCQKIDEIYLFIIFIRILNERVILVFSYYLL